MGGIWYLEQDWVWQTAVQINQVKEDGDPSSSKRG